MDIETMCIEELDAPTQEAIERACAELRRNRARIAELEAERDAARESLRADREASHLAIETLRKRCAALMLAPKTVAAIVRRLDAVVDAPDAHTYDERYAAQCALTDLERYEKAGR